LSNTKFSFWRIKWNVKSHPILNNATAHIHVPEKAFAANAFNITAPEKNFLPVILMQNQKKHTIDQLDFIYIHVN